MHCSCIGFISVSVLLLSVVTQPIQFSCHVRSKDVKTIQIKNPTNQAWVLRPVIEGHYWSGAESVTVDPLSTKPYEVTYKPVVMTADGRKHQVTCCHVPLQVSWVKVKQQQKSNPTIYYYMMIANCVLEI